MKKYYSVFVPHVLESFGKRTQKHKEYDHKNGFQANQNSYVFREVNIGCRVVLLRMDIKILLLGDLVVKGFTLKWR